MVTLVVLAIIAGIAAPSFNNLIEQNRVTTKANSFLTSINLARTEAIKRGAPVAVQAEAGGFQDGWCVVLGGQAACAGAPAGALLRSFPASTRTVIEDGGVTRMQFDRRGTLMVPAAAVAIGIEPDGCGAAEPNRRNLLINLAGRARIDQVNC
jgi:type IV fimbrial biogenesis protein FimT